MTNIRAIRKSLPRRILTDSKKDTRILQRVSFSQLDNFIDSVFFRIKVSCKTDLRTVV